MALGVTWWVLQDGLPGTKDGRWSLPLWSITGCLTFSRYWLLLKVNSEITNDLKQNPDPIKINGKIN